MSLRNLKNKESQAFNSADFKKAELSPARVISVILDNTHPKYTGEDSIGTIFYGRVDLNESSINLDNLNRAKPVFSFIKYFPLVNEIVLVFSSTSNNIYRDTKGDNIFTSTYYFPNLNIWNNPQHNALPLERSLKNKENPQEAAVGIQQNNIEKATVKLGEYFTEKETVKPIQPFEGDLILEGRFGNSIRMGATTPQDKPNNWSTSNNVGDPITIISNGQIETPGDTILENINETPSSIFFLSNQSINNFTPASLNIQSIGATFTPPSTEQVLIEDTPTPPSTPAAEPIVEDSPEPIIEETPSTTTPPTEEELTPESSTNSSIFALLDEAVEEGELSYLTNPYTFRDLSPDPFDSAARPEEYIEDPEGGEEIVNGLDFINQLPLVSIPDKVKYKPVYIEPSRQWTSITTKRLAQIINSFSIVAPLKYSVMFIALKEQPESGGKIGGFNYNHYGIMSDIGRWTHGSKINGSVAATEGAGGRGVRTDRIRYFASFNSEQDGVEFMYKTLDGKGFQTATENNIVDLYIDKWLSPSPDVAQNIKTNKRATYSNIFNTAKNLINAV